MPLRKLTPAIRDKVWGSPLTQPWFANPERRKIGEIWYAARESDERASLPVLVKFLFTSDRLSVQVHPDDVYAQAHGEVRGKTEMWHVLRAEPGAAIGFGLREPVSKEVVGAAALSGDIVDLLKWTPVQTGDTIFVPAGTIHVIGGGLALCEIQQFSDVTYRLFDYHRLPGRPLHLDDALAVAQLVPADGRRQATALGEGRELLAECEYFRTERLNIAGTLRCPAPERPAIYVAIAGEGTIDGEPFRAGEGWLAPKGTAGFAIEAVSAAFIVASGAGG